MTSKMSKYGTPKLDRANFDKALHEWLYDYFGEDIYYETETFDEVINYNLGIPTSLLESEYRDTDEIRVGGEYIDRDMKFTTAGDYMNDIQSNWK
tara:strand:- start:52 stop:336 length:285 start_codon:yes stop_codon:yes gene_type:complete